MKYMSTSKKVVCALNKTSKEELRTIGENTVNLSLISSFGIIVPDGFVITSLAFQKFLTVNKLQKRIEDLLTTAHYERADSLMQVSGHIKKLIHESKFPSGAENEILNKYKKLGSLFKKPQALIGPEKNSADNSEELINAIKTLWSSRFDAKHLLSSHHNNADIFSGMAIMVQKNIIKEKFGTVLTLNSEIQSKYNLTEKEKNEILKTVEKIKKDIYMPLLIEWAYSKKGCM